MRVGVDFADLLSMVPDGPDNAPEGPRWMMIAGVDSRGVEVIPAREFQWMPETLQFSAAIGWNQKEVAGGTHPIMQWGSNQGHTLSLDLTISRERHPYVDGSVSLGMRGVYEDQMESRYNRDIMQEINYLRAYYAPHYAKVDKYNAPEPPVTAWLYLPGLSYNPAGASGQDLQDDTLRSIFQGVVTSFEFQILRAFPNGVPRLAKCTLSLQETVQDQDGVHFVDRDALLALSGVSAGTAKAVSSKVFTGGS